MTVQRAQGIDPGGGAVCLNKTLLIKLLAGWVWSKAWSKGSNPCGWGEGVWLLELETIRFELVLRFISFPCKMGVTVASGREAGNGDRGGSL